MKYFKLIFTIAISSLIMETQAQECVNCNNPFPPIGKIRFASKIGMDNTVEGSYSFSGGLNSITRGTTSFSFGEEALAEKNHSFALGYHAKALDIYSVALGVSDTASGVAAIAIGGNNNAAGMGSMIFGYLTQATGPYSFVIGTGGVPTKKLRNAYPESLMIGFNSTKPTLFISTSPSNPQYNLTGKIGIGNITEPQHKLHIKADAGEVASVLIEPDRWNTGEQASLFLGNNLHGMKANERTGLTFNTQKNYYFPDGKVSIGRNLKLPETELDVTGTVKMTGLRLLGHNAQLGYILSCMSQNGEAVWQDPSLLITGLWEKQINDIFYNDGRVSINTDIPPTAKDMSLTVKGNQIIYGPNASLFFGDDQNTISGYGKYGIEHQHGGLNFWRPWEGKEGRSKNYVLFLKDDGNVGIGTNLPDYKLTVSGTIQACEIRVTKTAGGADFVFENDYKLKSLNEIEEYIKNNKHLPEIPSAQQMQEEGININELQIKLLQKIEELTLYVIEQQKRIEQLEEKIK